MIKGVIKQHAIQEIENVLMGEAFLLACLYYLLKI